MLRVLLFLCVAMIAAPTAGAQTGELERCGVMIETQDGLRFEIVPGFSVQTAPIPLRTPAGYGNVRSIMCGRPTLFIAENDHRVLTDLSMTLNISDGARVMVLEISSGQLRVRMISGELTDDEASAVQAALNRAQLLVDASNSEGGA